MPAMSPWNTRDRSAIAMPASWGAQREDGRPQCDQHVGPQPGGLSRDLPLHADGAPQDRGQEQSQGDAHRVGGIGPGESVVHHVLR